MLLYTLNLWTLGKRLELEDIEANNERDLKSKLEEMIGTKYFTIQITKIKVKNEIQE